MKKNYTLGVMLDLSRNAVKNLSKLENIFALLHKIGYNCVMLYMEDTYEVEGEPYFGYMRGRYSTDELRAIDSLGIKYSIEVIPCIQTLAHIREVFCMNSFYRIKKVFISLIL